MKLFTHSFKVTIYDGGFCWRNARWVEKEYDHVDSFTSSMKTIVIVLLIIRLL